MDNIFMILKIIFCLILSSISMSILADTYTAKTYYKTTAYTTISSACQSYGTQWDAAADGTVNCVQPPNQYHYQLFQATLYCPGGGTVSGANCINAPACVSPKVRSSTTGICENPPPPPCTAGQTKTLLIVAGTYPDDASPTFALSHDRTHVEAVHTTVDQGGCTYNLPLNPNENQGCEKSPSGILYCRVLAVQTGGVYTGPDTALDGAMTGNAPIGQAKPGCLKSALDEICTTTEKKNCGSVNGAQLCVNPDGGLTSNGYPAVMIDGQVVGGTDTNGQVKNCYKSSNNSPTCIELPIVPKGTCNGPSFFVCIEPEKTANNPTPSTVPLSHNVKIEKSTQTTANADGSTTSVTHTTDNIIGSNPGTTTTTTDSIGNSTTTSTGGGYGTGSGSGGGVIGSGSGDGGEQAVNCDKYSDTLGCQDMKGEGEFVADAGTTPGQVAVSTQAVAGFSATGTCPASQAFTVFGKSYSIPWTPVCSFASQLKPIILVVASIGALMIIFSVA